MNVRPPLALAMLVVAAASGAASAQLRASRSADVPLAPAPAPAAAPSATPALPPAPAAPAASEEKENAGRLAAAAWLSLLDRRDWGTAWETSAAMFRNAVPLATWMDGVPKVREPLGKLVERTPANSSYKDRLEGRPAGDYVTVIFVTKFEGREVEEVVTTVRENDGRWRVTGYSTR